MTNKFKTAISAFILMGIAAPAMAATQGLLGATSTGSAIISITKNVQAQVSDISDMTLTDWSVGGGAVTLTSNVCVYSSTGNYKITATGSGLANLFTLSSGLNLMPYSVSWNAGGVGNLANTGSGLSPNIQSSGFITATTANATCNGGGSANDTARVIVTVNSTDMTAAASSATPYTGTLTMLVSPY